MTLVDQAMLTAIRGHHGQVNHHDGEPYLMHVARVYVATRDAGLSDTHQAVAWLHDILEDTPVTISDLRAEFPTHGSNSVVVAVVALTKVKGESNEDYYTRVATNEIARAVKLHDLHDNFGRNHLIADEATRLRMAYKYSLGISMLTGQSKENR